MSQHESIWAKCPCNVEVSIHRFWSQPCRTDYDGHGKYHYPGEYPPCSTLKDPLSYCYTWMPIWRPLDSGVHTDAHTHTHCSLSLPFLGLILQLLICVRTSLANFISFLTVVMVSLVAWRANDRYRRGIMRVCVIDCRRISHRHADSEKKESKNRLSQDAILSEYSILYIRIYFDILFDGNL